MDDPGSRKHALRRETEEAAPTQGTDLKRSVAREPRQRALRRHLGEPAERDAALQKLEERVAELEAWGATAAGDLARRDAAIADLRKDLERREQQLADKEVELSEHAAEAILERRRLEDELRSTEGVVAQEAAEFVRRDRAIAELRTGLEEQVRISRSQRAVIAQHDAALAELTVARQRLAALERTLREMREEIPTLEADLRDRDTRLAAAYEALETTTNEYRLITTSTAWTLMTLMWRVRLWLAPHGGRREGLIRLVKRVFSVWRQGGPAAVITKVRERAVPTSPTPVWTPSSHGISDDLKIAPGYDVIVLPIIDWDFRFQRPQQMSAEMSKHGHRVFYGKTSFRGFRQHPHRAIAPGLTEIELPGPRTLTVYRHAADADLIDQWVEYFAQLRRDEGIENAVTIVSLPFWRDLAFRLRDRFGWKVIYDCMDSHAHFSTNELTMLKDEEELVRGSDLLVVTAQRLEDQLAPLAARHIRVPNAGDYEHFSRAPTALAPEIAGLSHPVVGYYGAISDWFDTSIVAEIAKQRPGWEIVLVGRTFGADLKPFDGLTNVHLLGEKRYDDLPAYLYGFDVCIIPFKLTPLTESTDPVKLYEFLSAGKPVISVHLPELEKAEARGVVSFAAMPDQFVGQIEDAIAPGSAEIITARRTFARENTWSSRYMDFDVGVRALFPKVSIIVLTYNNLELTKACLESIVEETIWPNAELIIVDNASADGTPAYLREFAASHECTLILNPTNEGFAAGNNRGIRAATGDYIVLLNNDTVVTRGWVTRMVRYFEQDASIGLVGPVTNAIGNEAKVDVTYTDMEGMREFARQRRLNYDGKAFDIAMLALFCTMMRRSLLDEIGLLDDRYGVGMFEDDDLAIRVKRRGLRIVCAEDVFIHHYHGAAFKAMPRDEYRRLFDSNRKAFEQKWGRAWVPHQYRDAQETPET